jgi:alkaline phosphatase
MIEFNKAVEGVVEWVETNSNWGETLVIVTADHETGYLTGPGSGRQDSTDAQTTKLWRPLINNGKGNLPGLEWHTDDHTNSLVAFYAKGAGSDKFQIYADEKDPVRGQYIDNVEIGKVMLGLWDLDK